MPFTTLVPPPEPAERRRSWPWLVLAGFLAAGLVAALYLTIGTAAPKPAAVASAPATKSWAQEKAEFINEALAAQGRALLAGDLAGYLVTADPSLHDEFTQRFHSLRALGVAAWTAKVSRMPREAHDRQEVTVTIGYCLGTADCKPVELVLPSRWTVRDGRAVATSFQRTVLPWDLTPLQAVVGSRVIVAAPVSMAAGEVHRTVAAAEQAAAVADRFARWGPAPKRYVVYVAGPQEWRTWWNGEDPDFDGSAHGSYGVAIRAGGNPDGLPRLLTHEFTHVVSVGDEFGGGTYWWLTEGLAEYASDHDGSMTRARLPSVRRYVRAGRWDGSITLGRMPADASGDDQPARYGIALLAVSCLVQRFGEDRTLDFFAAVVREWSDPETAAPKVFGTEWAPVAAGCATKVRDRAR